MSRLYPKLLFPGRTQTDTSEVKLAIDNAEQLVDSMNPFSWIRASNRIRELAPDLVIIQWWHPFFAPAFGTIARRCRKFSKVMFLCHNVLPHEQTGPVRLLTKFALSSGDMFVVHSEEDLQNLKDLIPSAKVRKGRHPTYEVFNQHPIEKQDARAELNLKEDQKVILFFGLIREYKGLKYLIQAVPSILTTVDIQLLIVGEFYDDREKYISLIKELGIEHKVRIRDEYIPNEAVGTYFAAADLVVLPYISATQSGIAQIAYGFDRPVVTTNVGGLAEAVKHEKTGLVVPPADPKALADAVVQFFKEDLSDSFVHNIREFREEFSWDRMVEIIEDLASNNNGDSR